MKRTVAKARRMGCHVSYRVPTENNGLRVAIHHSPSRRGARIITLIVLQLTLCSPRIAHAPLTWWPPRPQKAQPFFMMTRNTPLDMPEVCAKLERLGYGRTNHIRMYG